MTRGAALDVLERTLARNRTLKGGVHAAGAQKAYTRKTTGAERKKVREADGWGGGRVVSALEAATHLRLDRLCLTYAGQLPAGNVAMPALRVETRTCGGPTLRCRWQYADVTVVRWSVVLLS